MTDINIGQRVTGKLNRTDGDHVYFEGQVTSTYEVPEGLYRGIPMVAVLCTDDVTRYAFAWDVEPVAAPAVPTVTARQATPGTTIVIEDGSSWATVVVRRWTPAGNGYANLIASNREGGSAWHRGIYTADHAFRLASV